MAKVNKKIVSEPVFTAGGARASKISKELELRRSVLACMLWEDSFYEDGKSIVERISELIKEVKPEKVADIASAARNEQKLRHVPLLVAREMARLPKYRAYVASTLVDIIQRPDELAEFLAIYWKDKKQPLSNQVKKGLAAAFGKFDEYSLAKYNRDNAIKLRDVMFLTHPKPKDKAQEKLWKKLVEDKLKTPDTWEVGLSAGKDKKATFTRLINDGKLGAMALLKNLRGMEEAGVSDKVILKGLKEMDVSRVLPFRFLSAAKYAPRYEKEIGEAMLKMLSGRPKLSGKTVLIVDVSGSMGASLSSKSEMNRMDAAIALAMIIRELCEDVKIYATAGNDSTMIHKSALVPNRSGFALSEKIKEIGAGLGGGGIFLKQIMDYTLEKEKSADRVIVITDEQDCDRKCNPDNANAYGDVNYMINISKEQNGIGYKKFMHIDGFSEAIVDYIVAYESLTDNKQ